MVSKVEQSSIAAYSSPDEPGLPPVVSAPAENFSATDPGRRPHRVPLSGSSPRRLSFERRMRLWLAALAMPSLVLAGVMVFRSTNSVFYAASAVATVALLWAAATSYLFEQIMRPLQTLSNVVVALRDDDFSFRARGARRGDSLGDLALEVNALASTLQHQRLAGRDAISLLELVMNSMQSPVLAFDSADRLHLINPAAERAFQMERRRVLGRTADDLSLASLLEVADQGLWDAGPARAKDSRVHPANARWSVRRTTFRLHGIPHSLFVLADIAAALREEERLAWQRLIRVLGHEINNSLTPIKSIAGSLRSRLSVTSPAIDVVCQEPSHPELHIAPALSVSDLDRGLAVIEDRADSLNRFLQAYQRLSRLPPPTLLPTPLRPLIALVAQLETRLLVQISGGPDITLLADSDQLQQLLLNLLRNAADAAMEVGADGRGRTPHVEIAWSAIDSYAAIRILDDGAGVASTANLFVPFYTTKSGGSGVGLVLAQQIAIAHGGTVALRNRWNAPGCEAEVRLPLAAV